MRILGSDREADGLNWYRFFGFLLGTVASGWGTYYYVLNEYRVSNELLTEDIFVSGA
jgi:hypothetical protein